MLAKLRKIQVFISYMLIYSKNYFQHNKLICVSRWYRMVIMNINYLINT